MTTQPHWANLAEQFGTPLYVYDAAVLRSMAAGWFSALSYRPLRIHAALMANDNPHLLRICRAAGLGAFVNSPRHLAIALDAVGWSPDDIIYASSNTPQPVIERIAARGVRFHANSLRELTEYGALRAPDSAAPCGVGLRVAWRLPGQSRPGRLGVRLHELDAAQAAATAHHLGIIGLHVYLGTNLHDPAYYAEQVCALRPVLDRLPDVTYLDLSGGFPATPDFDYARFDALLYDSLGAHAGRLALVLEPGRALFARAGVFLTRVIEVRDYGEQVFVGVDGSASQLPLAMFHSAAVRFPVRVLHQNGHVPQPPRPVTIGGASTYSQDYFAREVMLPGAAPDDLLAFENAGAYGYSFFTGFLGMARPAEVLVDGDTATLITPREEVNL